MNVVANGALARARAARTDARAPEVTPEGADVPMAILRFLKPKTPAMAVQRAMLLLLVAAVVGLAIANPVFRSPANLLNIIQQASMVGVIACGMQLMIVSGGFDLSVGATAAAAGCLGAFVSLQAGVPMGIVAGLLLGIAIGSVNGSIVAKVGVNPFVATFGMQAVITGVMFALTKARPIAPLPISASKAPASRSAGA